MPGLVEWGDQVETATLEELYRIRFADGKQHFGVVKNPAYEGIGYVWRPQEATWVEFNPHIRYTENAITFEHSVILKVIAEELHGIKELLGIMVTRNSDE